MTFSSNKSRAVALLRVSTPEQQLHGESTELQLQRIHLASDRNRHHITKVFEEGYSGWQRDYRPVLEEMFAYLEQHKDEIDAVYVYSIDRFTRKGTHSYVELKRRLLALGIQLIDTTGIIQPEQNTLADLGFEYEWSSRSPSRLAEHLKAEIAYEEITTMQTRMIGQEIRLAQQGYVVRGANIGYRNMKVEDELGKKKTIHIPDPDEAPWIRAIFQLREEGLLSDKEICVEVNAMGFRTRKFPVRNRATGQLNGFRGGKPLTPKMLQRYVCNPIYCGIKVEKWTNNQPVRCPFEGLVSIDTFNNANRGKITVIELADGTFSISRTAIASKDMKNSTYPFRHVVQCKDCNKQLHGSASRGKTGKKYHYYHCKKGHVRIRQAEMHQKLKSFCQSFHLTPKRVPLIDQIIRDVWEEKQESMEKRQNIAQQTKTELLTQQRVLLDKIIHVRSEVVQRKLEEQIETLQQQVEAIPKEEKAPQLKVTQIEDFITYIKTVVEHPDKMLLCGLSMRLTEKIWQMFFEELPTYEIIAGRTPELSHGIRLFSPSKVPENNLAGTIRLEWNYLCEFIRENLPLFKALHLLFNKVK